MKKIFKPTIIFLIAFAVQLGPAYNLFLSYDYKSSADCDTYLAISEGNFKGQNLTRKYRVVVPFMSKLVSIPIAKVYNKLWPFRGNDDGPIRFGFFIVNIIIMSFVGVLIFYLGKEYILNDVTALIIMVIALIGGRWGNFIAAVPITDSFYMLIICMIFYSIKSKNEYLLIPCLILGPIAKEAYLMIIPYIFFLASFSKYKLLLYMSLGLVISWLMRSYIDSISINLDATSSLKEDFSHVYNLKTSFFKIFSIRGIGEMLTIVGVFSFIPIIVFFNKVSRKIILAKTDIYIYGCYFLFP